MKLTYHKIHPFKVFNSVIPVHSRAAQPSLRSKFRIFSLCQKEPLYPLAVNPCSHPSPLSSRQSTACFLSLNNNVYNCHPTSVPASNCSNWHLILLLHGSTTEKNCARTETEHAKVLPLALGCLRWWHWILSWCYDRLRFLGPWDRANILCVWDRDKKTDCVST
jgi:hypothetical protein